MLPNEPRSIAPAQQSVGSSARSSDASMKAVVKDSFWASLTKAAFSFRNHPWLKISALILSALLWAVLIAGDENIQREKIIPEAVVTVVGLESLQSRGMTITEDLASNQIKVKLRVKVAQRDYQTVTGQSFAPRLDLSRITQAGEAQEIKFTQALTTYGTVLDFTPASYTVNVEAYDQRGKIPVEVVPTGQASSSLWFDTPVTDPSQITVSGPRSLVNQVARAVVSLPIDSLDLSRTHNSLSELIVLQDRSGNPIESPLLRVTSDSVMLQSVRVDVDVYPMKELPIDTSIAMRGTPAHGYEISRTMIMPQTVQVAGPQATLDRLQAIYVETPIDISNASEAVQGRSGLRLAPELKYSSASEVVILTAVREATHTHTYVSVPIEVRGADASLTAELSMPSMSVVLSGAYLTMERVAAEDIHLFVDASTLGVGESAVTVRCSVDNVNTFAYTPQQSEVLLTLRERAAADAVEP